MRLKSIMLIHILLLLVTSSMNAQKAYKPIRESIKNRNNLDQALKTIAECGKDEKFAKDPELYYLGVSVYQKMSDVENEKIYLKQAYDTARFFSSIYGMFDFALRCDSIEQLPDSKGKIRIKYRNKNATLLKRNYKNLRMASKFYLLKKDYVKAFPFISMYLKSAKSAVLASEHYEENDQTRSRLAYWAILCLHQTGKYASIFNYCDLALQDTVYRCSILETMVQSYGEVKDTTQMLSTLRQGIREYPNHTYFFTKLFDYYNTRELYKQALSLADTMLVVDKSNILFRYAKSVVLLNMKRYDECITESLNILNQDSTFSDAYYNIGISYCDKAQLIEKQIDSKTSLSTLRQQKLSIQDYYQKALPFMEKFRAMKPDDHGKWGIALYRIYLNLNMGKKLDEIDKYLKEKNKKS